MITDENNNVMSCDTALIPDYATVKLWVTKFSADLYKQTGIKLSNISKSTFMNSLCTSQKVPGVAMSSARAWKLMLHDNFVLSAIDTCKSDCAVMCLFLWQQFFRCKLINTAKFITVDGYNEAAAQRFEAFFGYTGCKRLKVDKFGLLDCTVKHSNMYCKARPLGSYVSHEFKRHLKMCCVALNSTIELLQFDPMGIGSPMMVADRT